MKDHVKHIIKDCAGPKLFWCGLRNSNLEFAFQNIDHAAFNNLESGRLLPCAKCVHAIVKALTNNINDKLLLEDGKDWNEK